MPGVKARRFFFRDVDDDTMCHILATSSHQRSLRRIPREDCPGDDILRKRVVEDRRVKTVGNKFYIDIPINLHGRSSAYIFNRENCSERLPAGDSRKCGSNFDAGSLRCLDCGYCYISLLFHDSFLLISNVSIVSGSKEGQYSRHKKEPLNSKIPSLKPSGCLLACRLLCVITIPKLSDCSNDNVGLWFTLFFVGCFCGGAGVYWLLGWWGEAAVESFQFGANLFNADNNAARNSASDFSFGVSISSLWAGLEVALQANASDLAEDCNCDLARYLFGSSGARPGEFSKMVPVFKENVGREWPV